MLPTIKWFHLQHFYTFQLIKCYRLKACILNITKQAITCLFLIFCVCIAFVEEIHWSHIVIHVAFVINYLSIVKFCRKIPCLSVWSLKSLLEGVTHASLTHWGCITSFEQFRGINYQVLSLISYSFSEASKNCC